MSCTLEIVGHSTCIIYDSGANAYLAKTVLMNLVKTFFLLLLILLKDNVQNFEYPRTKCIEISDVLDSQPITDGAQIFFDPSLYKSTIMLNGCNILEMSIDIIISNTKAVEVIGDGDCEFQFSSYKSFDE